jgi:hypothetical protein
LSQGFLALVLFVVLVYFLPATLWAVHTNRRVARLRALKMGIYLFAAVSILVTNGLQNRMADRRAGCAQILVLHDHRNHVGL